MWSRSGRLATWAEGSSLYLFDGQTSRRIATLTTPIARPRFAHADRAIEFEMGEGLYRYDVATRSMPPGGAIQARQRMVPCRTASSGCSSPNA